MQTSQTLMLTQSQKDAKKVSTMERYIMESRKVLDNRFFRTRQEKEVFAKLDMLFRELNSLN